MSNKMLKKVGSILTRGVVEVRWINRIYHRSPIQTEKSQNEGKRIMPETRFTEIPALTIDSRVGISRSALDTDVYFSYLWR